MLNSSFSPTLRSSRSLPQQKIKQNIKIKRKIPFIFNEILSDRFPFYFLPEVVIVKKYTIVL